MNKFDEAYELFNTCQFDKSFKIFEKISQNELCTNEERAEAFNMMGVITSFYAPYLSPEDRQSGGLYFYKKSLMLAPYYLNALLNIVYTFGKKSHSIHDDKHEFIRAYKIIKDNLYESLDSSQRLEIEAKFDFFIKNEDSLLK